MSDSYINAGRKKQKQKTRNQILHSAKWFLRKGSDFTLEEIAERSSLSRATVYRYFSSAEVLSREAALDLSTKSSEEVIQSIESNHIEDVLRGIQSYYNSLAIDNEGAFRKYLSVVIASDESGKRGARRHKTIKLALERHQLDLSEEDMNKFMVLATTLMGIEPLIVTKDVCGLDNEASKEVLSWGLDLILKGLSIKE